MKDEELRVPLTYEERAEANELLRQLRQRGAEWDRFFPLAARAFRIPPGPPGEDMTERSGFKVGDDYEQHYDEEVFRGKIKRLRFYAPSSELWGLVSYSDGSLAWTPLKDRKERGC